MEERQKYAEDRVKQYGFDKAFDAENAAIKNRNIKTNVGIAGITLAC